MTDEEMAEEYAEKHSFRVPYDGSNKFYDDVDYKASKESFLAGLKAGRPQWHDLKKDPNDLPKGQINRYLFAYVKNYGGKKPMLVGYNGEWFYDVNIYNKEVKVVAWCEIPTFYKE